MKLKVKTEYNNAAESWTCVVWFKNQQNCFIADGKTKKQAERHAKLKLERAFQLYSYRDESWWSEFLPDWMRCDGLDEPDEPDWLPSRGFARKKRTKKGKTK